VSCPKGEAERWHNGSAPHGLEPASDRSPGAPICGVLQRQVCHWKAASAGIHWRSGTWLMEMKKLPRDGRRANPVPDMLQCWFVETFRSFSIEEALLRSPVDGSMTGVALPVVLSSDGRKTDSLRPLPCRILQGKQEPSRLPTHSVLLYTKSPGRTYPSLVSAKKGAIWRARESPEARLRYSRLDRSSGAFCGAAICAAVRQR
jgi:hypothetical protein